MIRKKFFYMLIVLQVLILGGIAASHYGTLFYGEKIVLKTEPVDPRDLFYGDYVILNYEISNVPLSLWKEDGEPDYNEKVYVLLKEKDSVHEAVSVYKEKPEVKEGEVALKAIVKGVYNQPGEIFLKYGLERYYVEEGTGRAIEEEMPDKVSVRVAPWGQVTVEELIRTSSQ